MFIENLESREFFSVSPLVYNPKTDIPPIAPSNITAKVITAPSNHKKYIQFTFRDNSKNEDYFIIRAIKGSNPLLNAWKTVETTNGLNTKKTTGTVTVRIPAVFNYTYAIQSYRNTPTTDIYRWSVAMPMNGIFIKKP